MTIYDIQEVLIDHFKTLNDFSGIEFLTDNNVQYPNQSIQEPEDKRWFEVNILNNESEPTAMFSEQDRYSGFMQIDICVPLDAGELEVSNKVKWISRLFRRGQFLGEEMSLEITNVSRANTSQENDHYKTTVRVYWTADIDIE